MGMEISPAAQRPSGHELSLAAAAAQAKAEVEARFIVAMNRPRNVLKARERLLAACRRPEFATDAIYRKPTGGKEISGLNIRFAEAAIRALGNIDVDVRTTYEDAHQRAVRVSVTDLESNTTYRQDIVVRKEVERKYLRKGQVALSERVNSYGEVVYLVEATEDQMITKVASLVSKAIRTLSLRLIPADLKQEAIACLKKTAIGAAEENPAAAQKAVADAFFGLGIPVAEVEKYLGHPLSTTSPAEVVKLRHLWTAIKDGETTWADVVAEAPPPEKEKPAAKKETPAPKPKKKRGRPRKKKSEPAPPPEPGPEPESAAAPPPPRPAAAPSDAAFATAEDAMAHFAEGGGREFLLAEVKREIARLGEDKVQDVFDRSPAGEFALSYEELGESDLAAFVKDLKEVQA